MPNIIIREQEAVTQAQFDVTENTVLIPMLYARNTENEYDSEGTIINTYYTESADIGGKLYTNALTFRNEMLSSHVVRVDGPNDYDKSYIMAYELLLQGLNVVIKPITYDNIRLSNQITSDQAYEIIENALSEGVLDEFADRNIFNIKFITTGGYANCGKKYEVELADSSEGETRVTSSYTVIRTLASKRGDAVALIEFADYYADKEKLFESINNDYVPDGSGDFFAAAFFPWCVNSTSASGSQRNILMPACFGYLMAYGYSVKTNANWFAAAGANRGFVPGLIKPNFEVGEALMHTLQGDDEAGEVLNIMVNPIYNAGTYGYRIWGNRVVNKTFTLEDRYMNFLNVRVLLCDIKKQIYHAAMRVTFEPNDDIVWINFKTLSNTLLERMKSGRGINWYRWYKEVTSEKATIKATLTIQPIEAVESFDINIVLTDEEATIEETI